VHHDMRSVATRELSLFCEIFLMFFFWFVWNSVCDLHDHACAVRMLCYIHLGSSTSRICSHNMAALRSFTVSFDFLESILLN
jgi:hypothetical protein